MALKWKKLQDTAPSWTTHYKSRSFLAAHVPGEPGKWYVITSLADRYFTHLVRAEDEKALRLKVYYGIYHPYIGLKGREQKKPRLYDSLKEAKQVVEQHAAGGPPKGKVETDPEKIAKKLTPNQWDVMSFYAEATRTRKWPMFMVSSQTASAITNAQNALTRKKLVTGIVFTDLGKKVWALRPKPGVMGEAHNPKKAKKAKKTRNPTSLRKVMRDALK